MRENATRFRFTAFRISSIDINTTTTLRRVSTPMTPRRNSRATDQVVQRRDVEPSSIVVTLAISILSPFISGLNFPTASSCYR